LDALHAGEHPQRRGQLFGDRRVARRNSRHERVGQRIRADRRHGLPEPIDPREFGERLLLRDEAEAAHRRGGAQRRLDLRRLGRSGIDREERRDLGIGAEVSGQLLDGADQDPAAERERERNADHQRVEQGAERRARQAPQCPPEARQVAAQPGLHRSSGRSTTRPAAR
jgi:hypothetical protein